MKEITLAEIGPFVRALHCPTRWKIIEVLKDGRKSSEEIYNFLTADNENLQKAAFYYHMRELEAVDIIKLDEYKQSSKKRAPEKVWKLNITELKLNFMK